MYRARSRNAEKVMKMTGNSSAEATSHETEKPFLNIDIKLDDPGGLEAS